MGTSLMTQFVEEVEHTCPTTAYDTRMGREMSIRCKELWEVLVHPAGNATMLTATKGCQLATVSFGVLPHLRHPLAHILTKSGQVLCVIKLLTYPLVTLVTRHPARPMPSVMGDIERLIPFRRSSKFSLCHRVGIIHATHLLILGEQWSCHQQSQSKQEDFI